MNTIVTRIEKILSHYNLSQSEFANSIKIQRSSVSHIFSGRNKPSLDFVQKILAHYTEIDSDWLLQGKNSMIESKNTPLPPNPINTTQTKQQSIDFARVNEKNVERVIIFYEDGTFKQYIS